MKKLFSIGIILLLFASVFLTSTPVKIGSAEAKIFSNEVVLFFDNFESYSVGSFPREVWEGGKALITNSKYHSPTKSLYFLADDAALVQKKVPSNATIVGFEVHLLVSERIGYPSGMIIEIGFPTLGWPLNVVGFGADGYIHVQEKKLQQYALNTWHKITVVMNKTSMKVSVWVDGDLKVTDVEVYRGEYFEGFTGISLVKEPGYSVYIDDVKVFTLENLVVEVYDYDGTPASKVEGTTWVELIKQGEVYGITRPVNKESKAIFTDLDPGTYYINVWHKPTKPVRDQVFWGQIRGILIEAGKTTSISFTRHMPIITSLRVLSAPPDINDSATIEIKIKNIADIPILVEASLIIMDELGTWIYSSTSTSKEVPAGGTATFLFNDFKPNKYGSYYGYGICNIHGTRMASDQKGWVYLFTVGAEDRQLSSGGGHDLFPLWSPDGSKLLFLKMFVQEEDHNICGNVSLWILDIESKSMKPIEEKQPWLSPLYSSLAWSPDGRRVAYSMLKMENEKVWIELFILNVSSMEKKLIYCEEPQKYYVPIIYGRSLGWLGNDKIVFLRHANFTNQGAPTTSEIVILSENGEKLRTLVKRELETGETPSFIISNIFVSNKRDAIGFVEFVEYAPYSPEKGYNMSSRIWLMNVDGSNRRIITELNNTIITSASFSQNDSIILINYIPMRENILPSLVAIDINTGKLKEIVASSYDPRSKTGFCILTDGRGQIYSKLRSNRIVYGNLSTTPSENLAEYSIWSTDINTYKEKLISKLFPIESIRFPSSLSLFFLLGGGPAVSSDGKIAYAYPDSEGKYLKIWLLKHEKLDVKFKGEVTDIVEAIDFAGTPLAGIYYIITVKVSEVLEDPTGHLKAGMIAHVTFPKDFPNVEEVKVGDLVEVCGAFKSIEDNVVRISLEKTEHHLRKKIAKWTVMAYLAGDCDSKNLLMMELPIMESKVIRILNDLEKIGSTSEVNIVALLDRHPKYDSSNGNWSDTRVFFVTKDSSNEINSKWVSWGELNTGNYKTLSAFIKWSINSYPAEHYFLILVGHGNGWRGVCPDETDEDELNATELSFALNEINDIIDVILFDSCLTGMTEIMCELKNHVKIAVASEDYIREHAIEAILPGVPYDEILRCLVENPNMDAVELGKTIVQKFKEANQYKPPYLATISAINVTRINELLNALDDLSIFLNTKMEKYLKDLIEIRNKIANSNEEYGKNKLEKFVDDCDYIDLYYFAQLLRERVSETGEVVDRLLDTINLLIVDEWHQALHSNSHGLSIYYPKNRASYEYHSYRRLSLSQITNWDEFLSNYVNSKIHLYPIVYLDGKVDDTHIDVPITITNMLYNIHVITFDIVELTKSRYRFSAPMLGFFPHIGLCMFDHWKVITSSGVEERRDNPLSYEVKNEETVINAHYNKVLEGTLVRLDEIGHKLYLHVYDNLGRHIGINHTTGTIEIQIPHAGYLDLDNGTVLILLPSNVTDFRCVIDAKYAEAEKEEYELTVIALKEGRDLAKTMKRDAVERGTQQALSCSIALEKKEIRLITISPEAEIYLLLQRFWYFFVIVAVIGIVIAYSIKDRLKFCAIYDK